jgi:hypothetical protein
MRVFELVQDCCFLFKDMYLNLLYVQISSEYSAVFDIHWSCSERCVMWLSTLPKVMYCIMQNSSSKKELRSLVLCSSKVPNQNPHVASSCV